MCGIIKINLCGQLMEGHISESVLEFDEKIVESGGRLSINNGSNKKNVGGSAVCGVWEARREKTMGR